MIRFWWPWSHYQSHTSTLNVKFRSKKLVCTLSLESNDVFWPNFMYRIIGIIIELIRFWWSSPNFQGHHTIKTVKMNFSALYLLNQSVDFDQTCTETPLRHGKEIIRFRDLDLIFKVTPALWMSICFTKKACLHPIYWTKWCILAKLYVLYHWDN